MFVPEFTSENSCVLVHNHNLETAEAVSLSAQFTRARLAHAEKYLPTRITHIEVVFDCRGQDIEVSAEESLNAKVLGVDSVEFKRS